MRSYLTPANTYNRAAIMRDAWANARSAAARYKSTPRREFAFALIRAWGIARELRSIARWAAEQDAQAARLASLPAREQAISHAHTALMFAEHNDTPGSHRLVAAARSQLDALQHAA
jgi:hypothetical protein